MTVIAWISPINCWPLKPILKKANREVVEAHLGSCVRDAFEKGNEEEKITEIMDLLDKMAK